MYAENISSRSRKVSISANINFTLFKMLTNDLYLLIIREKYLWIYQIYLFVTNLEVSLGFLGEASQAENEEDLCFCFPFLNYRFSLSADHKLLISGKVISHQ